MNTWHLSSTVACLLALTTMMWGGDGSWTAVVASYDVLGPGNGAVVPIFLPSGTVQTAVAAGATPELAAVTPDGTKALVTSNTSVFVFDLTKNPIELIGAPIPIGGAFQGVAITPDGTRALVVNANDNTVSVLDLTQNPIVPIGAAISVGANPYDIAITPNGTRALVTCADDYTVSVLNLTTDPIEPIPPAISVGTFPEGIAITPDGTRALVANAFDNTVSVLDLTQNPIVPIGAPISVGTFPEGIAITPDGTRALVACADDNTVSVLDLTTDPIEAISPAISVGVYPIDIAITPDGTRALVTNDDTVSVLDLTTNPIKAILPALSVGGRPWGITITPDQAPTSLFTFTINGLTATFDASGSSSIVGNIQTYRWNFGDGSDSETSIATTSHTYANSGSYTVSLTVVNDAGTSTEITFTGRTISNRGLPRARSEQTITVGSQPSPTQPAKFTGRVHVSGKHKKAVIKTRWKKSSTTDIRHYEIFAHNKKITSIKASHKRHASIYLYHHHISSHIPKKFDLCLHHKYRLYLHHKYKIRAVGPDGITSPFTHLNCKRNVFS